MKSLIMQIFKEEEGYRDGTQVWAGAGAIPLDGV
jgi:hypothetical protein